MISAYANELNLAASRSFSAIARSVMISAAASTLRSVRLKSSFSAIARSVMISAHQKEVMKNRHQCFSAIARSVMISALTPRQERFVKEYRFSAIARSVISAERRVGQECRTRWALYAL